MLAADVTAAVDVPAFDRSNMDGFAVQAADTFGAEELEPVLEDLVERGLQSDARFAEQLVAARVRRGSGPLRIRAELRRRGAIETAIDGIFRIEPSIAAATVPE